MFNPIKKIFFILLLFPLLTACQINSTIELDTDTSGKQTISIYLPTDITNQIENKEEILKVLQENKPIEDIVIETKEQQDTFEISYYFTFTDLDEYKQKSYQITGQEISLSTNSKGTPFNGTTSITIEPNDEIVFVQWMKESLQTFDQFKNYQDQPIETNTIINYQGIDYSFTSPSLIINDYIKINQLDIKTIVKETNELFRSFTYSLDTIITDDSYLTSYLDSLLNQIEFTSASSEYHYLIDEQSIIISISSTSQVDISLLTSSLFGTSATLITEKMENSNDYQYIDYFYPENSIFGEIESISYTTYLPNNAQTTTFHNIDYDEYSEYYGFVDYLNNMIVIEDTHHEAINVEMSYKLEDIKTIQNQQLIKSIILTICILLCILLLYFLKKKHTNKEIIQEPINFSIIKDSIKINIHTFISTVIYMFSLLLLGFMIIQLLLPQLQIIFLNQLNFSLYEVFNFQTSTKISLQDYLTLIPLVYGVTFQLKLNYFNYDNLYFIVNIGSLLIIPIISFWITNTYLSYQRFSLRKCIIYLFQASFITSFLFLLLVNYKNAQMSNELDILYYHIPSFLCHMILLNYFGITGILIFNKYDQSNLGNIIKYVAKRLLLCFSIVMVLTILFIWYQNKLDMLLSIASNLSMYSLFTISGGFLQANQVSYSLLHQPIIIPLVLINYFLLSIGLDKLQQATNIKRLYLYFIISLIYSLSVFGATKLMQLSLSYANYSISVSPSIYSLLIIFIFCFLSILIISNYKQYIKKSRK